MQKLSQVTIRDTAYDIWARGLSHIEVISPEEANSLGGKRVETWATKEGRILFVCSKERETSIPASYDPFFPIDLIEVLGLE